MPVSQRNVLKESRAVGVSQKNAGMPLLQPAPCSRVSCLYSGSGLTCEDGHPRMHFTLCLSGTSGPPFFRLLSLSCWPGEPDFLSKMDGSEVNIEMDRTEAFLFWFWFSIIPHLAISVHSVTMESDFNSQELQYS